MEHIQDKISVIIPTYNRAYIIKRALNSVINQTYTNIEIVIVDDGSTDNTGALLNEFNDSRLKIIRHNTNRGVTSAKNTGLNNISGEWFTFLDSDDELVPNALETLIRVPYEIDKTITAITCNCIDASTGGFTGKGIEKNQYIDIETFISKCTGEHWGLTKSILLGNYRFNEKLPGFEELLWNKISLRAKRYYINQGLRIYHTEGKDRISKANVAASTINKANIYRELSNEIEYWEMLKNYGPSKFARASSHGLIFLMAVGDKQHAAFYYSLIKHSNVNKYVTLMAHIVMLCGPLIAKAVIFADNIRKRTFKS